MSTANRIDGLTMRRGRFSLQPQGILRDLANRRDENPRREWYSIKNLVAGEVEILLYGIIGDSWFGGVTAEQFVSDLQQVQANKILLRVNSGGGAIDDATAIRNALIRHPATVESHIDGLAASSASWVALQDRVVMSPQSKMMIHDPWDFMGGTAADFRKWADVLDIYANDIADMYVQKAGGTRDEWRALMLTETWYTDQAAVDAGLADEIAGTAAAPAQDQYSQAVINAFKHGRENLSRAPAAPAAPIVNVQPDPELVRAALIYQRDQSRRLGAA